MGAVLDERDAEIPSGRDALLDEWADIDDRERALGIKLRERIAAHDATIEDLRQERDGYRAASETFARAMHVLTVENDNLRKEVDKRRSSCVTTLPPRR